jgi:hypothetical protein
MNPYKIDLGFLFYNPLLCQFSPIAVATIFSYNN